LKIIKRKFFIWLGLSAIALTGLAGIGITIEAYRAPLEILLSYRGTLNEIERHRRVWGEKVFVDDITLRDDRGTFVNFVLQQPTDTTRRYPAVVILGGVDIGKETLKYIDDDGEVIIAALAYPYDLNKVTGWWSGIKEISAMREAAFRTVAGALLAADFLYQKNVDTSRVILVGYSFGAPFVPAVMRLDSRYKVAAILYGGGRLGELIAHNLDTGYGFLDRALGAAAGHLLAPIEPLRHVRHISPRPLVMIQGKYDEFMPPHLAQELFDLAGEPKEIIWLETEHMMPWKKELINRVVATLRAWLQVKDYLPASAGAEVLR
jgi:dienelactone hydrolase